MTNSSIVVTRGVMNSAPFKRYKKSCRSYKLSSTHARIMHVSCTYRIADHQDIGLKGATTINH